MEKTAESKAYVTYVTSLDFERHSSPLRANVGKGNK